jgi:thioredoxin 1
LAITIVPNNLIVIKITDKKDFEEKVLNQPGLHLIRFCAAWSGPCQMMASIYNEMFETYNSEASFYKVDIDEAPLLAKELKVKELPTLLFYKNGVMVDMVTGMISKDSLIEKIEYTLNN